MVKYDLSELQSKDLMTVLNLLLGSTMMVRLYNNYQDFLLQEPCTFSDFVLSNVFVKIIEDTNEQVFDILSYTGAHEFLFNGLMLLLEKQQYEILLEMYANSGKSTLDFVIYALQHMEINFREEIYI